MILTGRSNAMISQSTSATSGSVYEGRQKQQVWISCVTSCWPCCCMASLIRRFRTSKSSSCWEREERVSCVTFKPEGSLHLHAVSLTSLETPVWMRSLMNFMTLQLASRWSSVVAAMAHWMMWTTMLLPSSVTGLRWINLRERGFQSRFITEGREDHETRMAVHHGYLVASLNRSSTVSGWLRRPLGCSSNWKVGMQRACGGQNSSQSGRVGTGVKGSVDYSVVWPWRVIKGF